MYLWTNTETYQAQQQQLEFLWVLSENPSPLNSSVIRNEIFAETQLDYQTGFYLILLVAATNETRNFMN